VLLPEGLIRRGDRFGPVALSVTHQPDGDVAGLTHIDLRADRRRCREREQRDERRCRCES
jgi:hypothetical protein